MRQAIQLAKDNISAGGGPFAAVVVKDGEIVATGVNRVTANADPTAHAEVMAVRKACAQLGTHSLEGCEIYSTCEPCPMCLGAIYWAHLSKLYYGADKQDAAEAGFDDSFIYQEMSRPWESRCLKSRTMLALEAREVFRVWGETADRRPY